LLVSLGALSYSFVSGSIADWQMLAYGLSVSALSISILGGLFVKRLSPMAAWPSVIAGAMGYFTLNEFVALGLSATAYGLSILFTRLMRGTSRTQIARLGGGKEI